MRRAIVQAGDGRTRQRALGVPGMAAQADRAPADVARHALFAAARTDGQDDVAEGAELPRPPLAHGIVASHAGDRLDAVRRGRLERLQRALVAEMDVPLHAMAAGAGSDAA